MNSRELIEALYAGTLPRIKDIRDFYSQEADKALQEDIERGEWPFLVGATVVPQDPAWLDPVRVDEITRFLWGSPLSHVAVCLIRAAADAAIDGELVIDEASVASVCTTITDNDLKRGTGLNDEHLRPVLEKTAEAFLEVVRAHGTIEVTINRKPIRLVART